MDQNQGLKNVIQFPGSKRDTVKPEATNESVNPPALPAKARKAKVAKSKKVQGALVVAVILGSFAVNHQAFKAGSGTSNQSSVSRAIASVEQPATLNRNAGWERELAESLASPKYRGLASVHVGRSATKEERLRWGVLEEKYTISWSLDRHDIQKIVLQDPDENPSYILDRAEFLREYGSLFSDQFSSAKLKSIEKSNENVVEAYLLHDAEDKVTGEAKFIMDRHHRLLSLKVEPAQI